MFCPNCAAQNDQSQHYCRTCGLNLDVIAAELTVQKPSEELAALLQKKKRVELFGKAALSITGIISLCLILALAVYYKIMLLGPEILFGSAIGALIIFVLASIFFFTYSKFFLHVDQVVRHGPEQPEISTPTGRLLNDPQFEPASVTEHSTEPLRRTPQDQNTTV